MPDSPFPHPDAPTPDSGPREEAVVHEQPTLAPGLSPPPDQPTNDWRPGSSPHDQPTLTPDSQPTPTAQPAASVLGDFILEAKPFGDYELLGEIARGGMGMVYRARERQSGRLVALKMMLAEASKDAAYLQRFILEARATGELSHPGIVTIHAWGEHQGQFFYTMDYVPGFPLSRVLKRKALPVPRAVQYLRGIAEAVAAAHVQGIVHRDLKPGNVVIDSTDQPRVLDFGLAKRHRPTSTPDVNVDDVVDVLPADPASGSSPLASPASPSPATQRGAVLGTPAYMAPEQARGEHDQVGPPADVHALGAIFFEMLTGRPPFEAPTMMDTLLQVMEQEPAPVRALNKSIPRSLAELCHRCLRKDPDERYPNAGALASDLERRWTQAAQRRRFARLAAGAGIVLLLMLSVHLIFPSWQWIHLPDLLYNRAQDWTSADTPMLQGGISIAAYLVGVAVALLPLVGLICLVIWCAAFVWYGSDWFLAEKVEAAQADAEPYLQKLFALRREDEAKSSLPESRALELADVELGKTIRESSVCVVRKGRQISLDRPVLVWVEMQRTGPDEVAPGVVVYHPCVLPLHAVGTCSESRYLVTGPAASTPLAEILEQRKLEPLEAVALLVRIARAVQAFHDQGICHGRLSAEWILVNSDLEPLLCPCGVPSQGSADRARDVVTLGQMLKEWLPALPRRWRGKPLAAVYRVCEAAASGEYSRASILANDLERGGRQFELRWRERVLDMVGLFVFALPLIGLLVARFLHQKLAADPTQPSGLIQLLNNDLLMLLAPSGVLLGLVQGWRLAHLGKLRMRLRWPGRWSRAIIGALSRISLITMIPGLFAACFAEESQGGAPRALSLAAVVMLSFWILGAFLAGLFTFGEFLLSSLRTPPAEILLGSLSASGREGGSPSSGRDDDRRSK